MAEDEQELVARRRAGDEQAFDALVARHYATMLSVARSYVQTRAVAEEVVQETWIAVLRSLDGFEGRSSLRTWICRILINTARRRAASEGRSIPFSAVAGDDEPAVDPSRFQREGQWAGHWAAFPVDPAERVLGAEVREHIDRAIAALRSPQREVIVLRDVEGWSSDEVCEALELTPANQRVLLHRARAKVRHALEDLL